MMSMSATRLKGNLATDILTQLQTLFPINASLLPAEKTGIMTGQTNLANAIANAAGPDIVTEVTNAAVSTPVSVPSTPLTATFAGTVS